MTYLEISVIGWGSSPGTAAGTACRGQWSTTAEGVRR